MTWSTALQFTTTLGKLTMDPWLHTAWNMQSCRRRFQGSRAKQARLQVVGMAATRMGTQAAEGWMQALPPVRRLKPRRPCIGHRGCSRSHSAQRAWKRWRIAVPGEGGGHGTIVAIEFMRTMNSLQRKKTNCLKMFENVSKCLLL